MGAKSHRHPIRNPPESQPIATETQLRANKTRHPPICESSNDKLTFGPPPRSPLIQLENLTRIYRSGGRSGENDAWWYFAISNSKSRRVNNSP